MALIVPTRDWGAKRSAICLHLAACSTRLGLKPSSSDTTDRALPQTGQLSQLMHKHTPPSSGLRGVMDPNTGKAPQTLRPPRPSSRFNLKEKVGDCSGPLWEWLLVTPIQCFCFQEAGRTKGSHTFAVRDAPRTGSNWDWRTLCLLRLKHFQVMQL